MCPEQQKANPAADGEVSPRSHASHLAQKVGFSTSVPFREEVIAFKFGGSSLLGAGRMQHSAGLVREVAADSRVIVVVSAMKGVTDRLLGTARLQATGKLLTAEALVELHLQTLRELQLDEADHLRVALEVRLGHDLLHETPLRGQGKTSAARCDHLASFGERFSARLFASALAKVGVSTVPVASSAFVLTCGTFQDAKPDLGQTRRRGQEVLLPLLEAGIVPVVTGFIGATQDGRISTLVRNSSDVSGAIIAYIVDAAELVIWTDVDGIFTANPEETAEAKLLHELSYDEAHALAASGAKVLHPHVLPLTAQTEMTVGVRNTFKPQVRGTGIGPAQNGGVA